MDRATEAATRNPHPVSRYKPYVIQSQGAKQLNSELASPIGIVGSFTHSMARKPRTRMIASECISIMPDGSRKIIAQASYAKMATKSTTARRSTPRMTKRAQVDIALMSNMGTIHTEA